MEENTKNPRIENAAETVRGAADRVADKVTGAVDSAKSTVQGTVDNLAGRAHAAADWTSDKIDAATEAPMQYLESGAASIRERPYLAVGIALALGYCLGRMHSSD